VIIAAAIALTGLAASCGGSDSGGTASIVETTIATGPPDYRPLAGAKLTEVRRIEQRVQDYCLQVGRSLGHSGHAPSRAELQAVLSGIDRLAELARQNPYAVLPTGADLRLTLGDIAENLEGANCSPEVQARISQVLAELPST
jgi:hypothetical protein